MAETLDKTTLTRMAWLTELRRQGHRQCIGEYWDEERIHVCALGLLRETASLADWNAGWVERATGLTYEQANRVVFMNDGTSGLRKHAFAEIADIVEGWFRD